MIPLYVITSAVADLGEGPGGPGPSPPPLFWVKKEEMTEGKMAAMASKSRPGSATAVVHIISND